MTNTNDDMERLISRRLDGELTDDENLELDRELLRNPKAHRLMEELRQMNERAGAALSQVICDRVTAVDPSSSPGRNETTRHPRHGPWRWLIPGAIAAALAALVIPRPELSRVDPPIVTTSAPSVSHQPLAAQPHPLTAQPHPLTAQPQPLMAQPQPGQRGDLLRNVSLPTTRRDAGRNIFGVVGDDGNIYWIEVDRVRTIRRPGLQSAAWETHGM